MTVLLVREIFHCLIAIIGYKLHDLHTNTVSYGKLLPDSQRLSIQMPSPLEVIIIIIVCVVQLPQ